jgi:hypothetical protein
MTSLWEVEEKHPKQLSAYGINKKDLVPKGRLRMSQDVILGAPRLHTNVLPKTPRVAIPACGTIRGFAAGIDNPFLKHKE